MGGEEFLVITPMAKETDCISMFGRFCAKVAKSKISTRSGVVPVTVSIGTACTAAGSTVDEILGAADRALYRAKALGRNRVECATEKTVCFKRFQTEEARNQEMVLPSLYIDTIL